MRGGIRVLVLAFALFLLLMAFPSGALAETAPATVAVPSHQPQVSDTLAVGDWIAYRLSYPGDFAKLSVLLTYSPGDDPNDNGLIDGNQVTLAIYSPSNPPPDGKPMDWAGGNRGEKRYQLETSVGGDYILIVNNWDSLGRPVSFTLSSVAGGSHGDLGTAPPVAALSYLSSAAGSEESYRLQATSAAIRVGIQAGHWRSHEHPDELARLRTSTGTSGGGVREWQLNLDVARRVAALLEAEGIQVDILPAVIPPGYQADAFVALHADGDRTGRLSGFKLAHGRWSGNPAADKALVNAITVEYQAATNLPIDPRVSRNMTGYYAFNNGRYQHAVARGTPAVILEMGFMTNASDLRFLLTQQDTIARGIANGILRFLSQG